MVKKNKKVEVEWIDAQSSLDTITINELDNEDLIVTKSCGYLIKKDNKKIILAFMLFGDDVLKHYQIIPIGMVKSIKELR